MRFWKLVLRSVRLRCPRCGRGKLFKGWLAMHETCDHCGFAYRRGDGYFLGAIYFNYGLTALTVTVTYIVAAFLIGFRPPWLIYAMLAFCLLFPLWFFRYARSLWVGFDQYFDPVGAEIDEP